MNKLKTGLLITVLALISSTAAAVNIQTSGLETDGINTSYTDQGIRFHNQEINKTLTYKEALIPSQFHDYINKYKFKSKEKSGQGAKIQIQIQLNKSSSLPNRLQGLKINRKLQFNNPSQGKVKYKGNTLQTSIDSHNANFRIKYEVIDNQGSISDTYTDFYTDEDVEKIPFSASANQVSDNKYRQKLVRDNKYGEKDTETVHIIYPEESNLSEISIDISYEECSLSYLQYAKPKLESAGLDDSIITNSMYQRESKCYNITTPENGTVELTANFTHEMEERNKGELVIGESPEFYTYITGSGAATRVTGTETMCGTVGNESIVVKGTLQICDSGVTLDTEDLVRVYENAEIDGEGADTENNGEDGAPLTINTNTLILNGTIDVSGGNGGNNDNNDNGGHGGNGAQIDIDTYQFIMDDATIDNHGGDGGSADNDGNGGGGPGGSESITINSTLIDTRGTSNTIQHTTGDGGDRTCASGKTPGSIDVDAYNTTLTNLSIFGKPGDPAFGAYDDIIGEIECSNPGVQGPTFDFNINHGYIENSYIEVEGSDGAPASEYGSNDGGPGGEFNSTWNHTDIIDTEINADGGDAGDVQNSDKCAEGGDGGYIGVYYINSFTDAFNNFHVQGGDDDGGCEDGSPGTIEKKQDQSLTGFLQTREINYRFGSLKSYDRQKEQVEELYQAENLTVEYRFITEQIGQIDQVNITLANPQDDTKVRDDNMSMIGNSTTSNGRQAYIYQYNYSIPQNLDSSGEWLVTTNLIDVYGNNQVESTEFTYQYIDYDIDNPVQGEARVGQPIRFDQDITIENPSNTEYGKDADNVKLTFDLIENVVLGDTELQRPDNSIVEIQTRSGDTSIRWNETTLSPGQTKDYTVIWYLEEIIVEEEVNTTETDTDKVIAEQEFTFKNPSNSQSLTDVELQAGLHAPKRTVSWQLFTNTSQDISNSDQYGTTPLDSDNDGFIDTIEWEINSLQVGTPEHFTLISDLGKPIKVYKETVITNRPVEPGKPIKWREGFAFLNRNNFNVPFDYRIRIPIDASNLRLDGQIRDTRFDNNGPYVLLDRNLPDNSNTTAFLKYETRSISTPPVQTDRPDRNYVGQGGIVEKTVQIENLVDKNISNIRRNIEIDYGENLKAIDVDEEEVIDSQDTVQDQYTLKLDTLEAEDQEEIRIAYEIPVGNKEFIRDGQTNRGNRLKVWRVDISSDTPLDNVYFETEEIDCTQVQRVRISGGENSSIQEGTEVEDYECGSTIVPIGSAQPGDTYRIGISYQETQVTTETNPWTEFFMGAFKPVLLAAILIGLYELLSRGMKSVGMETPWSNSGRNA